MTEDRDLPTAPEDVTVKPATAADRLDVLRILDAAVLETDAATVDDRIAAGDVIVARSTRTGGVVGALVAVRPDPDRLHVDAVAVRQVRRGEGIGSRLVAAAVDRAESDPAVETVTARFDADLAEFYAALGFAVDGTGADEGRRVGRTRVDGG
ncbi:GNAT family N-acetyltransferase [Halorubrum ezzemoulense]|uniref:GNAT family N-acetyltransferase n=1 Tax=Halorubrum ezzemoulense TaxID=337243 RepID=UPI00232DC3E1|nr:GNAT family N-acetyltransferase [Halorubrum ezzemoulense]MDB9250116.1 GNAT family N-acetyltransferase [Halorubrum ezzemoulense]MDB9260284.1 GNAT family N-acetyltransferase [Halorubrum ezzemoulense]MDB9263580.1 GNAT family N-acetyltransferase [Halorubrum ezzemoulense]MDB9267160.1 GNAT family N-acetyltransferase [Halorubrum ezzemoulense]MDB9270645.1 GNAT family N-acetyltransferase [Halorubrum ezzemoulense]